MQTPSNKHMNIDGNVFNCIIMFILSLDALHSHFSGLGKVSKASSSICQPISTAGPPRHNNIAAGFQTTGDIVFHFKNWFCCMVYQKTLFLNFSSFLLYIYTSWIKNLNERFVTLINKDIISMCIDVVRYINYGHSKMYVILYGLNLVLYLIIHIFHFSC